MADHRAGGVDSALPAPPQVSLPDDLAQQPAGDTPGSLSFDKERPSVEDSAADVESTDAGASSGAPPAAPSAAAQAPTPAEAALAKNVEEVLASEIGISTLLGRLKQSIASAKEFALFLKKRAILEDDHAQSLKKLCRSTQDNIHRADHRQGTFAQSYDEMMFIHDRMAENGIQFAASLHQMHEDLVDLSANAERHRKTWKANGLAAEQRVADLEQTMRKSKAKYDSLAEEYDRARTGEGRQGGKVLGAFKAHKSAAQQEEDLLKKVQAADQVYLGHVQGLQSEKAQLVSSTRPEAIKALQDLVNEIDAGLTLQMQKFASFNEKLLLGNGVIVYPFKNGPGETTPQPRSLRQAVSSINNERDLNDYVASHRPKVQPNEEIKYERHPVLNPPSVPAMNNAGPVPGPQAPPSSFNQNPTNVSAPQPLSMGARTSTGNFGTVGSNAGSMNAPGAPMGSQPPPGGPSSFSGPGPQGHPNAQSGPPKGMTQSFSQGLPMQQQQRPFAQQPAHNRAFSQGNHPGYQGPPGGQHPGGQHPGMNPAPGGPRYGNGGPPGGAPPPQLGNLPFQGGPPGGQPGQRGSPQQSHPFAPPGDRRGSGPPSQQGPPPMYGAQGQPVHEDRPTNPVFNVSLNRLYERDGLAVPMVVYQCIQAVDLYGLGLEGIYRQSGSLTHINKLKQMFNNDSQNPALDFRNPENFYHDVNSVTGLLKQFFRDLPDPILTREHHDSFIAAAKQEDDIVRRDSLHAIINSLPDPNYATLRAITLHLYRVMDNAHSNRMNSHNLAVIFGPTLMGSDAATAITDAGWQIKVVDTILQNTYQIFDED